MGNQQTTRRVSFEREQTGLIAISDSVAKRLKNAEGTKESSVPVQNQQDQTREAANPKASREPLTSGSSSSLSQVKPRNQQQEQPYQHSTQDEHNNALARLEEQWQERYKRLEGDSERVKQISAEEFTRAVKHVETIFESKSYAIGSADLQRALMNCYKENPTRSLKCSRDADAFIKSIEDYKMGFLSKQVV